MPKLSKAPVFFTLAQMRFNAVLQSDFVEALQSKLGVFGFPDFERESVNRVEFSQEAEGVSFQQHFGHRFVFRNVSRTAAVILDPSALHYETTAYPVFEEFSETFFGALRIVHEHRPIHYCDRIGMRMLDAVQPDHGDKMADYVVAPALGMDFGREGVLRTHSLTESAFANGPNSLVVRSLRYRDGIAMPPDLLPLRLRLASRFVDFKGDCVIIDSDAFCEERVAGFDPMAMVNNLRGLKDLLKEAFESIVTRYALEKWK